MKQEKTKNKKKKNKKENMHTAVLHWSFDVDVLCYHGPYKDAICDHRRMACPFKKTLGSTATKASKALDLMDSMAL